MYFLVTEIISLLIKHQKKKKEEEIISTITWSIFMSI